MEEDVTDTASTRDARIRKASRHRRDQEKEELRQIILKAAGNLFLELGYDRFSMRRVAEEIGYSVATLYLYFQNKDELLFAIVDTGFSRFIQQLTSAAGSTDDPWTRLEKLAHAYISFGLHNPVYYQLMFLWRPDYLTQSVGDTPRRLESFQVLTQAVQTAIDTGAMIPADAHTCSDTLWAIMHGIVSFAITLPSFDDERIQAVNAFAQQIVRKALIP
jgi:AcrR family transcriptional regulator